MLAIRAALLRPAMRNVPCTFSISVPNDVAIKLSTHQIIAFRNREMSTSRLHSGGIHPSAPLRSISSRPTQDIAMTSSVRPSSFRHQINPPNSFSVPTISLETGETTGTAILDRTIFGAPVRLDLIHRVVIWQLAARRAGLASSKGRGEKSGSTRKIYRQKGTGHARAGTIRAPQRKGSGKAHGPHPKDWSFKLQKKVRVAGLRSALSSKFALGELSIASDIPFPTNKTKMINKIGKKMGWNNHGVLIIHGQTPDKNLSQATKNLSYITYADMKKCNVYEIIRHKFLILDVHALQNLQNRLGRPTS